MNCRLMNQHKSKGTAVVYLNSRAIQDRLDDVLGALNWHNEYMLWQENSQICGISIYDEDRKEWITKYDGAENTEHEPIKGGLSDSFKRAAIHWGIGRYLYDMGMIWIEIEPKGKSFKIKESEKVKLKDHYNKSIHKSSESAASNSKGKSNQPKEETSPNARAYDFKIVYTAISGSSAVLQLIKGNGEKITAYAKKDSPGLAKGALLKNVNLESKKSEFGP